MNTDQVDEIIDRYGADRTATLAILQDIQAEYNHLPREALTETARRLGVRLSEIYRIATFFNTFSLEPKGEHIIKVCLGTACHVGGGPRVLEQMERDLGIKAGGTTPDGEFSLEAVRCVGACALGPVVVVDDHIHGKMSGAKATKLIPSLRQGEALPKSKSEESLEIDVAVLKSTDWEMATTPKLKSLEELRRLRVGLQKDVMLRLNVDTA